MRSLSILTVALVVLVIGFLVWKATLSQRSITNNRQEIVTLADLPTTYCPTEAKVVFQGTGSSRHGSILPVKNCRTIDLTSATLPKGGSVFFKLPRALAFEVAATLLQKGPVSYAPELGDTNDDNSIDATDEKAIIDQLFSPISDLDLDGDRAVTALDLALVRLHQGTTLVKEGTINWEDIQ